MKNALIIIIIIAIIAAGVMLYYYYHYLSEKTNGNVNANKNVNEKVNVSNTNVSNVNLSGLEQGDIQINKTLSYKNLDFNITTAAYTKEYSGTTAPEGKKYVIIYFNPKQENASLLAKEWILTETKLIVGEDKEIDLASIQFHSDTAAPRSHFLFEVDEGDSNFKLRFGAGETAKSLDLGF